MVRHLRTKIHAHHNAVRILGLFAGMCLGSHDDSGVLQYFLSGVLMLTSMQLIIFRAFQGIGGGGEQTLSYHRHCSADADIIQPL